MVLHLFYIAFLFTNAHLCKLPELQCTHFGNFFTYAHPCIAVHTGPHPPFADHAMGGHLKFIAYFTFFVHLCAFKYLTVLIELVRKWEHGRKTSFGLHFYLFKIQSCKDETGVNIFFLHKVLFLKQRSPQESTQNFRLCTM
jgi:hypothetical protein